MVFGAEADSGFALEVEKIEELVGVGDFEEFLGEVGSGIGAGGVIFEEGELDQSGEEVASFVFFEGEFIGGDFLVFGVIGLKFLEVEEGVFLMEGGNFAGLTAEIVEIIDETEGGFEMFGGIGGGGGGMEVAGGELPPGGLMLFGEVVKGFEIDEIKLGEEIGLDFSVEEEESIEVVEFEVELVLGHKNEVEVEDVVGVIGEVDGDFGGGLGGEGLGEGVVVDGDAADGVADGDEGRVEAEG